MSGLPTVNMIRRVLQLGTGDVRYEVTVQVTNEGDLPFKELFVASVLDTDAEKRDVLARVVTPFELREETDAIYVKTDASNLKYISGDPFVAVSDVVSLTQLPRDRTSAIQRGATKYLTTTVTVLYDSVTAAEAAYRTLLARLSQLVNDYRKFRTSFVTNPSQDYTLPQTSVSVEDELIAAYRAAKLARVNAEKVRDGLQKQKDACAQADAANNAVFAMLTSDLAFLRAAKAAVAALVESGTLVLTGGTTLNAPGTYTITPSNTTKAFVVDGGNPQSYEALLNAKQAQWTALHDTIAAHDATCGAITRQLRDAQIAVDAARTNENNALAAVLAVCPTFDASTVTT